MRINGIEVIEELAIALAKVSKLAVDSMDKQLRIEVMDALALGHTAIELNRIKEESKK